VAGFEVNPLGLPPLNLAASGGDAANRADIANRGGTYNGAFNVGAGAGGLPSWAILAALALAAVLLWRR
jgi:hypothetical protein